MKKLLLTLACIGLSIGPSALAEPGHAKKDAPVFSCSFGAKQVLVTGTPGQLTYQFGSLGNVEKTIIGNKASANVFYHADNGMRWFNDQLRFTAGSTSYMLYHREYFGNADHDDAENRDGLIVLQGTKKLADMKCKSGPGFNDDVDLSSVADDTAISLAEYVQ